MRRLLPSCLLLLAFLPLTAHADTITFTLGTPITFFVPLPTPGFAFSNDAFEDPFVEAEIGGRDLFGTLQLFASAAGGGFDLTYYHDGGQGHVRTQGAQLFSGTVAEPMILLGDFDLKYGNGISTLSITSDAAEPTPEPSTLALVATGLVGVIAAVRRRRIGQPDTI